MSVIESLTVWVHEQLAEQGRPASPLNPILGDAGFREYFRLNTQPSLLAVYGPPAIEKHQAFVTIAQHWRNSGVPAPRVFAHNYDKGFLLIEDFGHQSLGQLLEQLKSASSNSPSGIEHAIAQCYQQVLAHLRPLQTLPLPPISLNYSSYDQPALLAEMALFSPWFVDKLLGYSITEQQNRMLQRLFEVLSCRAILQPQVIVHRDFHCRNIHVLNQSDSPNFGFIDFQDAVIGPVTYDIVSLLKDCYQLWPSQFVNEQALAYRQTLPSSLQMHSEQSFLQAFNEIGLQRHLKVLGVFARLYLRDGKSQYLSDLPLVIAYVRQALNTIDCGSEVASWFEAELMPLIAVQPWFRSVEIQP